MKKTGRKTTVFFVNVLVLIGVFVLVVFKVPEILGVIFGPWLFAFVSNGAVYISGNVAYAFQKSKYYQPELNEGEDGENT